MQAACIAPGFLRLERADLEIGEDPIRKPLSLRIRFENSAEIPRKLRTFIVP